MAVKNEMYVQTKKLVMTINFALDIAQQNVITNMSMFALSLQKMDVPNPQPANKKKKITAENIATNNTAP